jgi:hypothetical protein
VTTLGRRTVACRSNDRDLVAGEVDTASDARVASPQR